MPYLNSNNVIIRNTNAMDTVKLFDMLSKLGVIKRKKRRVQRQPAAIEAPIPAATRFLGSSPIINVSNNTDAAKIGEADAIRREAFYHVGRLTDAINRQQRADAEEPARMQPIQHIEREVPETQNMEIQTDDSGLPNVDDAEMDRFGPNDKTAEMADDRIIDYAGESGAGLVDDEGDDGDWVSQEGEISVPAKPEENVMLPEPIVRPEIDGGYEGEGESKTPRRGRPALTEEQKRERARAREEEKLARKAEGKGPGRPKMTAEEKELARKKRVETKFKAEVLAPAMREELQRRAVEESVTSRFHSVKK